MMDNGEVADLLNELLELESASLTARLAEAHLFLGPEHSDQLTILQRLVAEAQDQQRRLAEAIDRLGGTPRNSGRDPRSASVHYLDLNYLLPSLTTEQERLVEAYRRALSLLTGHAAASSLASQGLQRHEHCLEQLEALTEGS